ncbi:MAG: ABC transporter substrate-binding protein [Alphaproteobacteria bacterium]
MAITLYENLRALFYAPFYAAKELGAYAAEGIEVAMTISPAPERTPLDLAAGKVDVVWGGPMRVMREHDLHADSDMICFVEVIQRDPFFLVGRTPRPGFAIADLKGQRFGAVSEVPTPWLCLKDDLHRAGMSERDMDVVDDRTMAENSAALREGRLDAVQLFEPYVEQLVRDGAGYVWYAQASRGPCSYTTFNTTRRALAKRPDDLAAMARAMLRTQRWLAAARPEAVAEVIRPYFPDLDPATAARAFARCRDAQLYASTPVMSRAGFDRLRDGMLTTGWIARKVTYDALIDTTLAEAAVAADPVPLKAP